VHVRFLISVAIGVAWVGFSVWIALPWINSLATSLTLPLAILLICGIAIIPGYLNLQLLAALLLDNPRPLRFDMSFPSLTLMIAAYNEEETIAQTVAYALEQEYPADWRIVVIDDGSEDDTARIVASYGELDERVSVLTVPHGGKARALNAGLELAHTPLVATIDADTLLMPTALRRIVARYLDSPSDTRAVAGTVLVRNSRHNALTSAQEWDYFLGIASIKREQALLQGTLVAQGAFSVYDTAAVRDAGGWPDKIGEDIVLTWALLANGARTGFEATAVAFTTTPTGIKHFARQRSRWARGMIEGLRMSGRTLIFSGKQYAHSVASNLVFPYLDLAYCVGFIPGVVLAVFFGNYAIVGLMTLLVLPLNLMIGMVMLFKQRAAFGETDLRIRRNLLGYGLYFLGYQMISSPVSVAGYAQELLHRRRVW
jgi:biofilm PGA synthesis N-glycosyltransferase PgaC